MIEIKQAMEGDSDRIRQAAMKDNAAPIASTHVVMKEGEIVGALSIGIVTQVFAWVGSGLKVRDSIRIEKFIEEEARRQTRRLGLPPVFSVLVDKPSPLHPLMRKVGFVPFGEQCLYIKPL